MTWVRREWWIPRPQSGGCPPCHTNPTQPNLTSKKRSLLFTTCSQYHIESVRNILNWKNYQESDDDTIGGWDRVLPPLEVPAAAAEWLYIDRPDSFRRLYWSGIKILSTKNGSKYLNAMKHYIDCYSTLCYFIRHYIVLYRLLWTL